MRYKLLKDMPGIKAGTIFHANSIDLPATVSKEVKWYMPIGKWCPTFSEDDVQNTEWFEPIYQWPTRWEDIPEDTFANFYKLSMIGSIEARAAHMEISKSCVPSAAHAKSMLAFAQLSMLAAEMNGDWKPTFTKGGITYYTVRFSTENQKLYSDMFNYNVFIPISFKTREMAEFSAKHHADLWKQYFMID